MNTKWLDDLFYFLSKDYGTRIVYTKIGKADIDYTTGKRKDVKTSWDIPAVMAPVTIFQQYMDNILKIGKPDAVEKSKSRFLVSKHELEDVVLEMSDYIVWQDKRFTSLGSDDLFSYYIFSGVATNNALPYRVLNLTTNDQLGLGDGL